MRSACIAAMAVAALGSASLGVAAEGLPPPGQMVCGERQHLVSHLGRAYSEAPSNLGLAATGDLLEVLTSESGTWTILITQPNGVTCVVAAGESWETLPRVAMGAGL